MSALDYASLEYQKFKDNFINTSTGKTFEGNVADFVDEIIDSLAQSKTSSFPFFYEDMVGHGSNVSTRTYTVLDSSEVEYAIDSKFDVTAPSNRAVYVYVNDVQLVLDHDYTFSTTDDTISISKTLAVGDIIKIYDYSNTTGSFICFV